jgi:uncharacterized protein YdaU (DUF1376 family)
MGMDQVAKDRVDAELAAEKSKLAELEAAQNKMRQERDKTAREQFMARFKAQIENAKRLVDIEASEMRRLFELQFSKPFDVRFIPGQESLAGFGLFLCI